MKMKKIKKSKKTPLQKLQKKIKDMKSKPKINKPKKVYQTREHKTKFIQNFYNCLAHPEKNCNEDKNICMRSSYEIRYCMSIDRNPDIIKWGSENVIIPYFFPFEFKNGQILESKRQIRRYYMDFYVKYKDGREELIEIKPLYQVKAPIAKEYKTKYSLNNALFSFKKNTEKWKNTEKYCEEERKKGRQITFHIVTETQLSKLQMNFD